ncbi:MAG: diacylglycerol kinase family lipid kinase [Bacteroidia bacterium]|nr:diacylglycerol kinase family lipid kinase [Bacteroidia bacterium]
MAIHWTLIHNPRSCSGKGAKHWPEIEKLLQAASIDFEVLKTEYAGHAIVLTKDAIARGARNLVAVGGDGTVNEVLNGIFQQASVPSTDIVLTQIPIGTGNDWRRTVGIPKDYASCVKLLSNWQEIRQDVGVVEWETDQGTQRRYFDNVAGMGFEAAVGIKANADKAAGKGGILGYIPALVGILFRYKMTSAAFVVDGKQLPARNFFTLAVGICKFNGGGMQQCPGALLDDGLFDLTVINELPKWKVIWNFPGIFTGKFVRISHVEQHRCSSLAVTTGTETLLEVDGENIGQGTAKFSILPKALRVATVGKP